MLQLLKNYQIIKKWYTRTIRLVKIVEDDRIEPDLCKIAMKTYNVIIDNNMFIEMEWFPRTLNEKADLISKIVDYGDWESQSFSISSQF